MDDAVWLLPGIDFEQREFHPADGGVGARGRASHSARRTCGRGDQRLVRIIMRRRRWNRRSVSMLERAGIRSRTEQCEGRRGRRSSSRARPSRWMPSPRFTVAVSTGRSRACSPRCESGDGRITVITDGRIFRNRWIGENDHAALLAALIECDGIRWHGRFHARLRTFACGPCCASICGRFC